ncbi:MAG: lipoprotein [Pseudomonadota bacterium]
MTPRSNRSLSKLTTIGLLALTCVLAGCGRKAGLDLPPGAPAAQADGSVGAVDGNPNSASAAQRDVFDSTGGVDRSPRAPRGEKKRIPLDALLD